MTDKIYTNNLFFNLDIFEYKELLSGRTSWETISELTNFLQKIFESGKLNPNFRSRNDVFVGDNTLIDPSVEIRGPAIIGKNCEIKHGAFLREGCIIGDNVIIGHASEIKHTIILNDSRSAHLNYIGDSVIGNNVNISGGAIIANFRLDKRSIHIKTPSGMINTHLEKFGAAIGDNSVIGVNSVINPGTLLGKNSIVYPLKSISGVHEDNEVLK